jgi:hypothetical protein
VPESIELLTGAAMADEVGRLPPLESPAAPTGATWELGQARQRFLLGTLALDLRLEIPWATAMPELDGRARPFCTSALQRELNAATAALPSVRRLPHLEAASARAAAREARRAELAAERDRLLGEEAVPDDLADRLAAIDAELAPLASAAQVSRRLAEELDRGRARALRDASMIAQALNEKATGDLLNLREGFGRALMQLPGLQEALYHLVAAMRLCESASHTRLGDVQAALASARLTAPQTPQDGPSDAGGPGPGPEPAQPPGPPTLTPGATPAAPAGAPEANFDAYLTAAFEAAKKKAALEDAPPPPPATPTNRLAGISALHPNGHVEPFAAGDELDAPQVAEGQGADEIDAEAPPAGDLPDAPQVPDDAPVAGPDGPDAPAPSPLAQFLAERAEVGPGREVEVAVLLNAFNEFASANDLPPFVTAQELGKALRGVPGLVDVVVVRHQVGDERPRFFKGVGLKAP